jgi:hypothetical protein
MQIMPAPAGIFLSLRQNSAQYRRRRMLNGSISARFLLPAAMHDGVWRKMKTDIPKRKSRNACRIVVRGL